MWLFQAKGSIIALLRANKFQSLQFLLIESLIGDGRVSTWMGLVGVVSFSFQQWIGLDMPK